MERAMPAAASLTAIARRQDAKVQAYLQTRERTHFWLAGCIIDVARAEKFRRLQELGFDNYPVGEMAFDQPMFFFERLLGCRLHVLEGREGSFFHTWCEPIIEAPGDIERLEVDLGTQPLWRSYVAAVQRYAASSPPEDALPLSPWSYSPLDLACSLCGTERLFTFLYDAPRQVETLFDRIGEVYLETRRQMEAMNVRWISPQGLPGVYISDLRLPNLSPETIERFILPLYLRLAEACGGATLALLTADVGVLAKVMASECVIGCYFDKRLPFSAIRRYLGPKLFMIAHYAYDDSLDRPTLRDGLWWNPIVDSYSRELDAVYREFARDSSMLILVERPCLEEVCRIRKSLEGSAR